MNFMSQHHREILSLHQMDRAQKEWSQLLHGDEFLRLTNAGNLTRLSYTIYGCMLVLPHNAFKTTTWQGLVDRCTEEEFDQLYKLISKHLKITHIAINNPIPRLKDITSLEENTVRAPQNFTPLYGDFGTPSCPYPPTQEDFDAAFWVTAKQNSIYQTWAPRWTMFSRGNVSEKARLLILPSVQIAVEQGNADGRGSAAVDLYAGIGYFAFSYLKAGFDRVLCWDINPWSIEGLRRGALANKWAYLEYTNSKDGTSEQLEWSKARLLISSESNEHATTRVQRFRAQLPPIRHVNCGLLPTSRGSWQIALDVLDPQQGGWIHVHENFAVEEIGERAEEVREALEQMVHNHEQKQNVRLEYIHRLKSYAPGVMHCVLDICVAPINLS
jgi:tRNA wybutosine-synthesizing protein 2